jgi:hypothetical protein
MMISEIAAPSRRFHLIVGSDKAGMVFFACEQAPLMTIQNAGPPTRCPICGIHNPLNGKPDRTKRS